MGQIPTHVPGNGEYTHPIALANILSGLLDRAGIPLTADQKAEIAGFGAEFEGEYGRLQESYGAETTRLEKVVDELALKQTAKKQIEDLLTAEQKGQVIDPKIHDRIGIDCLSPVLMATLLAQRKFYGSKEEAKSKYAEQVSKKLGLDAAANPAVGEALEAWYKEVEPLLDPQPKGSLLQLGHAVAAGKAQVSFLKKLLALPNLDEKTRGLILGEFAWQVPQVAASEEK